MQPKNRKTSPQQQEQRKALLDLTAAQLVITAARLVKSSYLIKDSFPTKMDAKFFGHLLQEYLGELQCTNNDLQVPRGKHAGNLAEEGQEWSLMLF